MYCTHSTSEIEQLHFNNRPTHYCLHRPTHYCLLKKCTQLMADDTLLGN